MPPTCSYVPTHSALFVFSADSHLKYQGSFHSFTEFISPIPGLLVFLHSISGITHKASRFLSRINQSHNDSFLLKLTLNPASTSKGYLMETPNLCYFAPIWVADFLMAPETHE